MFGVKTRWRRYWDRVSWAGTATFWEKHYARGGTSGAGSYGHLATFKAGVLNRLVEEQGAESVIEFGCGDGHQLTLAEYPSYTGLDVAASAIDQCLARFREDPTKSFFWYDPARWKNAGALTADMALSLDVIFHLVEDDTYDAYMRNLFSAARKSVVIYASDTEEPHPDPYMRHRRFTEWVAREEPAWHLVDEIKNDHPFTPDRPDETSYSDFYVFARS